MKTYVDHIQINVCDFRSALKFYKKLFSYLGYKRVSSGSGYIGVSNGTTDFWIMQRAEKYGDKDYHRKGAGINHIAFRAASKEEIDKFAREFLQKEGVVPLYGSPRRFPEYTKGYYAVYFEGPDRIKLEVAFISNHVQKQFRLF